MTATYDCIATTTLSSTASTVTFSSISGSFTDLVFVFNGAGSTDINVLMQFNSDTGSNYSTTNLGGTGSSALSGRVTSSTSISLNWQGYVQTTNRSNCIVSIQNYSNSTTYKTILSRFNNASVAVDAIVGLWRSTSAITSIDIKTHTGTFSSGATFTLFGIKAE